jgi:hypothetical protein
LQLETIESFGKSISNHVVGGTINEGGAALHDGLANEMEMNVDMLGTRVVRGILRQRNSTLIITKESGGGIRVNEG